MKNALHSLRRGGLRIYSWLAVMGVEFCVTGREVGEPQHLEGEYSDIFCPRCPNKVWSLPGKGSGLGLVKCTTRPVSKSSP